LQHEGHERSEHDIGKRGRDHVLPATYVNLLHIVAVDSLLWIRYPTSIISRSSIRATMNVEAASPDVIVVGAGQAGLSLSYFLRQNNVSHIVLERDRPFSSWHHRWDGFYANTPNWMNSLPRGVKGIYPGKNRNGFATKQELIEFFDQYLDELNPPLQKGSNVTDVRESGDGTWEVRTDDGSYKARNVVICTGAMAAPRLPSVSADIPPGVPQMHSSEYRNPGQLHTPEVLIVGSGSSGVQICKELCRSGRFNRIHLATSNILVLPRHVCGIQIHRFLYLLGFFQVRTKSMIGRLMYSSLETRGDPIVRPHPQDLARQYDVKVYGKVQVVDAGHIRFADGQALATQHISILWCCGYNPNYSWIRNRHGPINLDRRGYPIHDRGIVKDTTGLYFVGLRYQHTVASHDIFGVGRDAEYVASHIAGRLSGVPALST
jgi:putative flavoprotein involved in K+ transport